MGVFNGGVQERHEGFVTFFINCRQMPNKSETWFNFELILKAIWSMKPVWYLNLNFDIGDHTDLTTFSNTKSIENKKVE